MKPETELDSLKKFAVKLVDGSGSGCLFQPATDAYSYVLTAKHVVEGRDSATVLRLSGGGKTETYKGNVYPHPDKDAALIKIPKIDNITELRPPNQPLEETGYYLLGYPDCRNDQHNKYVIRISKVSVFNTAEDDVHTEIEIHGRPMREEVVGMSGGGIIKKVNNNDYILAGIQIKMRQKNHKELLGRTLMMPLYFFNEIIDEYEFLAPLLESFPGSANKPVVSKNLELTSSTVKSYKSLSQTVVSECKTLGSVVPSNSTWWDHLSKITDYTVEVNIYRVAVIEMIEFWQHPKTILIVKKEFIRNTMVPEITVIINGLLKFEERRANTFRAIEHLRNAQQALYMLSAFSDLPIKKRMKDKVEDIKYQLKYQLKSYEECLENLNRALIYLEIQSR